MKFENDGMPDGNITTFDLTIWSRTIPRATETGIVAALAALFDSSNDRPVTSVPFTEEDSEPESSVNFY